MPNDSQTRRGRALRLAHDLDAPTSSPYASHRDERTDEAARLLPQLVEEINRKEIEIAQLRAWAAMVREHYEGERDSSPLLYRMGRWPFGAALDTIERA